MEDAVINAIYLRLLRCRNYIPTLDGANEVVLIFGQALRLAVTKDFVELLLAGIASAVNACGFAEPIYRSFDACGGCDGFNGIS